MIEDFYARIGIINSNPNVLENVNAEDKDKLKEQLTVVTENIEGEEETLAKAIDEFNATFDGLVLNEELAGVAKTRSLGLKTETKLPRQIINDATIMTLKNF